MDLLTSKVEYGFMPVNFSFLIYIGEKIEDEISAFSSKIEQVFCVEDPWNVNWYVVIISRL